MADWLEYAEPGGVSLGIAAIVCKNLPLAKRAACENRRLEGSLKRKRRIPVGTGLV